MKAYVDIKKISLSIKGVEMTFSEEELIKILENYFNVINVEKTKKKSTKSRKHYEVNPMDIIANEDIFKEKRDNSLQETTRKIIIEAIGEAKRNPKYKRKFETIIPKKIETVKTVKELEVLACNIGEHMADWVEQALEWAQKIIDDKTWEKVCNNPDTNKCYRLVKWKNGQPRIVGGSTLDNEFRLSPSNVDMSDLNYNNIIIDAVPLVIVYK